MDDYDFAALPIAGPPAAALSALTKEQIFFLRDLPKAELHAHLNGSIPLPVLQELARDYSAKDATSIDATITRLRSGVQLDALEDFFGLFPAIYALTSAREPLACATRGVLEHFLGGKQPQAAYLELRTTPKATVHMNRRGYLETVLDEIEKYSAEKVALIVSLDRTMDAATAREVVELAIDFKKGGRRVVAVDLCGNPMAGDMKTFKQYFEDAKKAGLGVTLHIAETETNSIDDTVTLLSCGPNRLGHATFLNEEAQRIVCERNICVEICLTSNLLCKTVKSLDDHHMHHYLRENHPVAICTDDILPFRNSLLGEYALLLAPKPHGLGFSEEEVRRIAVAGMNSRFGADKT
ncbi:Metallo-dependent hydrolase [Vararia minispora EC-137]|uniref:Metallo-dependent hydrolase n=1 Tax=Vararia minispora EC-137 TaxID=1314806 RepID=A0ACB8QPU2_9AGAM|nr:Metallo-dependent hydrolase [Vararia minispora EC-137]